MQKPHTAGPVDGRRTATREAIRRTLAELASERGMDRTTLRDVADRLSISRPAVYYHFDSKQDVLADLFAGVLPELETVLEIAHREPASGDMRAVVLDRLSSLAEDDPAVMMLCARLDEEAMRETPAAARAGELLNAIILAVAPADTVEGRLRSRLAVTGIFMASIRSQEIGGTASERYAAARAIAARLTT